MNSSVREAAKFHTVSFKYDQSAVVAALNISEVCVLQTLYPFNPIALRKTKIAYNVAFLNAIGLKC